MRVCSSVSLPNNFRKQDVLLFFGRDQQQTSERVTKNSLQKAFMMDGVCAFLDVSFGNKRASFTFDLDTEDVSPRKLAKSARSIVKHVLGLNQQLKRWRVSIENTLLWEDYSNKMPGYVCLKR